jgi:Serine proteases of the peptidase family S9A
VFQGIDCQYPQIQRCFVSLSRGGADAVEVREFDLTPKDFVPAKDNPFFLKEAKSRLSWIDTNQAFVGPDFGDGQSLTGSGFPRVVKLWQRGTPLEQAKTILIEGKTSAPCRDGCAC